MKENLQEEWRVVKDFPRYEVSNMGRVRSNCCWNGHKLRYVLKPWLCHNGYYIIHLHAKTKNGCIGKYKLLHKLVAEAFIGKRPKGLVIDHINGDHFDNRVCNLRYVTNRENCRCQHRERYKDGFKLVIFQDGKHVATVEKLKQLREVVPFSKRKALSINNLFPGGRIFKYKNYHVVLVLATDDVEPGIAPHVQFRLEV